MQPLLDDAGPVAALPDLQALIAEGQERGSLTAERIAIVLADVDVTKEQVAELHDYLGEQGIAILSPTATSTSPSSRRWTRCASTCARSAASSC